MNGRSAQAGVLLPRLATTLCAGLLWACLSQGVESAEARIAVAANFRNTALAIAEALQRASPHRYEIIAGSTGKLASQILNGAPYDIFMAADRDRPQP